LEKLIQNNKGEKMFKKSKMMFMHCDSPLHAGVGSDLGIVDLPIQRERHTNFPKVEGSSLKGAIREAFEDTLSQSFLDKQMIHRLFGYDDAEKDGQVNAAFKNDQGQFAGALAFTDARLLLFPVKSMKGIFAWITCPAVIQKLVADCKIAHLDTNFKIPEQNQRTTKSVVNIDENHVILEESTITAVKNENVDKLAVWLSDHIIKDESRVYWKTKIQNSLLVVSDDEFRDFVTMSTEVITRTKINNETGTVATGALFTEEFLPADSILYSLLMISPLYSPDKGTWKDLLAKDQVSKAEEFMKQIPGVIQLGGDATIGKGLVRVVLN
jgi:CRISPR-associated protein Cmr4